MRILHCLAQYPDRTGSGVYCRNLIRSFRKIGLEEQAVLFAHNSDQKIPKLEAEMYPLCFDTEALPFPLAGMSDVMPYRSTVYHCMDEQQMTLWKEAFRARLREAIETFQPDLIICHHLWILCTLCLETGLPVLAISHGTDLRQAAQNPELFAREVKGLDRVRGIIALTEGQIPDLLRHSGVPAEKIMVGGGAFDEHVFYPRPAATPASEHVRFLYAGKIADAKGVFELVEAFMRLPDSLPASLDLVGRPKRSFTLDLIGKANEEELKRLEALISHDKRIRLMDAESQLVLAEHMRNSDVFLFPSYYEGLGLIALEALASGLRLVTTDLPALREFLGPEIWSHPYLTVVPMPSLACLDRIREEAREDHIVRLTGAMREQGERALSDPPHGEAPLELLDHFSWSGLAGRIQRFADNVLML